MTEPLPSDESAVVAAFLQRYFEDQLANRVRPLRDYQALYPDFETVIAREHSKLHGAPEEGEEQETADAAGPPDRTERVGPYRILEEIGRGGQGVVYLAEDTRLRRRVALKMLTSSAAQVRSLRARLLREAEAASRLDHPGICSVYEVGEQDGIPFIAMRYVEGDSLAKKIQDSCRDAPEADPPSSVRLGIESGDAPPDEAPSGPAEPPGEACAIQEIVLLFERAARALHAAHEEAIVHRDIKPGNILVTRTGQPVLVDFGLARDESEESPPLTQSGTLLGTPAYMAPEQIAAQRIPVDRRADVYSLGAALFECLTLHRSFEAPTREQLYHQILVTPAPDVRRFNPAVPRDLKAVLETSLEKDRDRRYQTALDLAEDLRHVRLREPVRARPLGTVTRLRRWAQREPAKAALIALLMVVLPAGAYAVALWPHYRESRRIVEEQARQQRLERLLEEGFLFVGEELPDRALETFDRALALAPEAPEAVAGQALALARMRRAGEALAFLDGRRDLLERHPALGWVRVEALHAAGRSDEANRLEARLGVPGNPLSLFLAASRQLQHGHDLSDAMHTSNAEEAYNRAADLMTRCVLKASPARPLYHFELAHALGHLHDGSARRRLADVLLATYGRDSTSAMMWYRRGFLLQDLDNDETIYAYRKCMQLNPRISNAPINLAQALVARGDLDEAVDTCRKNLGRGFDAGTYSAMGRALKKGGDRDGAIEAFRRARDIQPRSVINLNNLGTALYEKQLYREAIDVYERALELNPRNGKVLTNLGGALLACGENDRAARELLKAVQVCPDDAEAHINLGIALRRRGDLSAALAAHREALRLDPGLASVHLNLGNTLKAMGNLDEATVALRKALTLDPGDPNIYGSLADVLKRQGKIDAAIEVLDRGLEARPEDARLHHLRGQTLMARRDFAQAVKALEQAVALASGEVHYRSDLALALHRSGSVAQAKQILEDVVQRWPDEPAGYKALATVLMSTGQVDATIEVLKRLVLLEPDHPGHRYNLGIYYHRKQDYARAADCYRGALERKPQDPRIHYNLGLALHKLGDLDGAVLSFRTAVKLKPDFVWAHEALGAAWNVMGDLGAASGAYRSAVALKPDSLEAQLGLGNVHLACGEHDAAITAFREALRIQAHHPEALCNLGLSCMRSGRFEEGLRALERGHQLGLKQPGWSYPSAAWIARCRDYREAEPRLDEIIRGETEPASLEDRVVLAETAFLKKRDRDAVRLYREAFEEDPTLADDLGRRLRFQASRAAARAGDRDDGAPWRDQAMTWLEADLQAWQCRLDEGRVEPSRVRRALTALQHDPVWKFGGDGSWQARLSTAEQKRWQALQARLDGLLKRLVR